MPHQRRDDRHLDPDLLRRVALGFDVDEGVLHNAAEKQSSPADFIERTERVREGLEHQLGGEEALKTWFRSKNGALNGKRPVEFLKEGQIDVLERVEEALKGLQFG
jgi:hypothetical protein